MLEKLKLLIEHITLFDKTWGKTKNFSIMKKHFKAYVAGWAGTKELRTKLMKTDNAKEVKQLVKAYRNQI